MKCVVTYFPRLEMEMQADQYAGLLNGLQKKLEQREIDFVETIAYSEESALDIIDDIANEYQREMLVLTDSWIMAEHCKKWFIPLGVVLCRQNRGDSFPQGAYCMESLMDVEYDYLERIYQRGKDLPWTIVETQRLLIREITTKDVSRLYELYADTDITAYMESLFPTLAEEEEYTKKYIENVYHFYGYGMWIIIKKDSGELIGRVGLEYHDDFDGLELGFMLGKDYWHQGYAYEACQAVLTYGRQELEQTSYRALVHFKNAASRKLCERLGFHECGTVDLNGACHIDYRLE